MMPIARAILRAEHNEQQRVRFSVKASNEQGIAVSEE